MAWVSISRHHSLCCSVLHESVSPGITNYHSEPSVLWFACLIIYLLTWSFSGKRLNHVCDISIHVCDMALTYTCDMTHLFVWHAIILRDSNCNRVWNKSFMCVTWVLRTCDTNHCCVRHDWFMCVSHCDTHPNINILILISNSKWTGKGISGHTQSCHESLWGHYD